MRILWTLLKVVVGLMVVLPVAIVALVFTIGVAGALLGLAIVALKLACVGLLAYGAFRLVRGMFGWNAAPAPAAVRELGEPTDRYYDAAMRELDMELGRPPSR